MLQSVTRYKNQRTRLGNPTILTVTHRVISLGGYQTMVDCLCQVISQIDSKQNFLSECV